MTKKRTLLAINGSASANSSNEKLIDYFVGLLGADFEVVIYNKLKTLPHFDPKLSSENPPQSILDLRKLIEAADAVLICTPEYIFSIPSGLKNALEWCVATTVFSNKPTGIITASAHGQKGHDELKLIMQTLTARLTDETTLLIAGIRGKVDDENTKKILQTFAESFRSFISTTS